MGSVPAERWVEGRACLPVSSTFPHGGLTASSHYPLTPAVKSRWGFNCLKGIMVDSRLKRINWRDGEKS
jgi:hypothetical protein